MTRGVLLSAIYLAMIVVAIVLRLAGVLHPTWFWIALCIASNGTTIATLGHNRDLRDFNELLIERLGRQVHDDQLRGRDDDQ